jgi:hypothetical protein
MSSSQSLTDPTNDADRVRVPSIAHVHAVVDICLLMFPQIRMKRLARLQQASSTSASPSPSTSSSPAPPPAPTPKPKVHKPAPTPKSVAAPIPPAHVPPRKKAHIAPSPFHYDVWENETIGQVFQVTLDARLFPLISGRLLVMLTSIRVHSLRKR